MVLPGIVLAIGFPAPAILMTENTNPFSAMGKAGNWLMQIGVSLTDDFNLDGRSNAYQCSIG